MLIVLQHVFMIRMVLINIPKNNIGTQIAIWNFLPKLSTNIFLNKMH